MRSFQIVRDNFRKYLNEDIKLPTRGTSKSSGYDFYSPIDITIKPNSSAIFWTDIKACMEEDEFLMIIPRSSLGIKKNLMLNNCVGNIDSDYYSNKDNDGNIGVFLYNYGDKIQIIEKGERIVQGIFCKYMTIDNDIPLSNNRIGGIGSTNK